MSLWIRDEVQLVVYCIGGPKNLGLQDKVRWGK